MLGNIVKADLALLGKSFKELRCELKKRGIDVSQSAVSMTVNGHRHNEKIENAIYDIINEWKGKK